jgi:anti-sigma B factor antagonist
MNIEDKQVGGVTVISLSGRLDALTSGDLEQRFGVLVSPGKRWFVLDMAAVDYVSSGGLRVILAMTKQLTALGGDLVLACLHPFVEDIISIAGFNSLVRTAVTVEEAISTTKDGTP